MYTTENAAKASGGIGKTYSVQLGKQPKDDGYATVGDRNKGSYRIPSIVKTTVNGKTRLVAAFDVRYRGQYKGNGDVGTTDGAGSDITVVYSDNGGATWTPAKNKTTGQKPAIDVKNVYDANGQTLSLALDTDVCDPQLTVFPDGTIYCGMAGGAGILGKDWAKSNFRMFKSTDGGETWKEDTDPLDSYAKKWRASSGMSNMSFNLTTPGHGIILTKNVPGVASMTAGTPVLPCQGGTITHGGSNYYGIYLAHGTGAPSTWNCGPAQGSSPLGKWNDQNTEEGQICQLDDGSILMVAKRGSARLSRFANGSWVSIPEGNDAFSGGGGCQIGVLKVAEGNGSDKYGIVAVSRSLEAPSNTPGQGRGNITVGFARDLTSKSGTPQDKPLDAQDRYYINIRAEKMCYFGYTDMVMINDTTLGVLYENWHETDNSIDGMRFVAIDVSKIIEKLSVKL